MKNRPLPEAARSGRLVRAGAGIAWVLVLACSTLPAAVDPQEYETAISSILCDCGCHPQSVKDCACGRAAEMRNEIAAKMEGDGASGPRTAAAIIAMYVAEHGEQILVSPPVRGFNLLAWVGPFVVLVLAVTGVTLLVRRWTARPAATAAVAGGEAAAVDPTDPYMQQLQRELEERE